MLDFASLHILANNYQPLKWALGIQGSVAIKTFIYFILGITFSFLTFETIPFNGCSETVCVDFQTYELYTIPFAILAVVFCLLCLIRLIKSVNLQDVDSSKDIGSIDG